MLQTWSHRLDIQNSTHFGRINKILTPTSEQCKLLVAIQKACILKEKNKCLNMPEVVLDGPVAVVHPKAKRLTFTSCCSLLKVLQTLLFEVNVQHACRECNCGATRCHWEMQEQALTEIDVETIKHTDNTRFNINMHALHNAARLCKALPRDMVKPKPYHADCMAAHSRSAKILHASNNAA